MTAPGKVVKQLISANRFLFVCLTCASGLMLGTGSIWAQELISAKVLSSEGQVEIRRAADGQPRIQKIAFKVDDEVKAGHTIITGRSGRLVLGLADGSQAVIAPQTTVVIKDLTESPRTLFNVIRGKTRVHIEKLGGQPNPYRVNTPTAVIAVRGTIFEVVVKGDETQVFLHEGEVEVTNLTLPDQPVRLFAGQMTRVLGQRLPDLPGPFSGHTDRPFQINGPIAAGRPRPELGRVGFPPNGPTPNGPRPNADPRAAGKKPWRKPDQ